MKPRLLLTLLLVVPILLQAAQPPWALLYPNATPGLYGTFGAHLSQPCTFLLWAREEQAVSFTTAQKSAAKGAQPDLVVTLKDPAGQPVELAVRGANGSRLFEFTARKTGAFVLSVDPKGEPVILNSTEAPLCLYAPQGQFPLLGASGLLYFSVPAGLKEFALKISLAKDSKIKATLHDALGNAVCAEDDLDQPARLAAKRMDASRTEVWSLKPEEPSHGACAGNQVTMEGLLGAAWASPESLMAQGVSSDTPPVHVPRLLLVGDSMVSSYPKPPPERPTLTGWGQVLNEFMTPGCSIDNRAHSGASARSFIERGYWTDGLLQPLDYVLIHFGGNDQKWGSRYGAPDGSYQDYLRSFILMARARGIKPILVTSVNRRDFQDGKLIRMLYPYTDAMKQVGAEEHVPVIDLHESSIALWEKVGEKGCEKFCPGDNDHGHTSRQGALELARIVAEGLQTVAPELKPTLRLGQ